MADDPGKAGTNVQADPSSSGGTTRRTALKVAAATGIGAYAWSGPTISHLGGAPAYAGICTKPTTPVEYDFGTRNTDVSCYDKKTQTGGWFRWKEPNNTPFPVTFSPSIAEPGRCSTQAITATFSPPGGSQRCRFKLGLVSPAGGGTLLGTFAGPGLPVIAGASFQAVPPSGVGLINIPYNENTQLTLTAQCVPAGECFPDEIGKAF